MTPSTMPEVEMGQTALVQTLLLERPPETVQERADSGKQSIASRHGCESRTGHAKSQGRVEDVPRLHAVFGKKTDAWD